MGTRYGDRVRGEANQKVHIIDNERNKTELW